MTEVTPHGLPLTADQVTGWLAAAVAVALALVGLDVSAPVAATAAAPSVAAIERPTPPDPPPALVGALPTVEEQVATYEVASGDTLSAIAAAMGVSVDVLLDANGLDAPDTLELGRVLVIPPPPAAE